MEAARWDHLEPNQSLQSHSRVCQKLPSSCSPSFPGAKELVGMLGVLGRRMRSDSIGDIAGPQQEAV